MNRKLAVLISGSYRNFDLVWDKNKSLLDQGTVPYEVFFHCWRDNPNLTSNLFEVEYRNKLYLSLFPKEYEIFSTPVSQVEISEKFQFNSICVQEFPESQFATEFNLGDPESNVRYQALLNSVGMYFGINACVIEMMKDQSFTHFLRLRTDFELDASILKRLYEYDVSFFGQLLPTPEGPIGDQCFGGLLNSPFDLLEIMSNLRKTTRSPGWNISNRMVLAEDIMRQSIFAHRNKLKIGYFDDLGKIVRPRLVVKEFSLTFLTRALLHNFFVLINVPRRAVKKLGLLSPVMSKHA